MVPFSVCCCKTLGRSEWSWLGTPCRSLLLFRSRISVKSWPQPSDLLLVRYRARARNQTEKTALRYNPVKSQIHGSHFNRKSEVGLFSSKLKQRLFSFLVTQNSSPYWIAVNIYLSGY